MSAFVRRKNGPAYCGPGPVCQRSDFFVKAPSDEGAVSEADWGREKAENMLFSWKYGRKPNIISPSVAYGASSLIRGSLRCGMHQRFFDGLKRARVLRARSFNQGSGCRTGTVGSFPDPAAPHPENPPKSAHSCRRWGSAGSGSSCRPAEGTGSGSS